MPENSSSSSLSSSSMSSSSSGRYSLSNISVSTSSSFFMSATRLHTSRFSLSILDLNGVLIPFNSSDVVRVKIGVNNQQPLLDLDSSAATPNGSTVTNQNPVTLTLDQDDLTMSPGIYDVEVLVMDDMEGTLVAHVGAGIMAIEETQLGDFEV